MIQINPLTGIITLQQDGRVEEVPLGTPRGFQIISKLWLRSGWDTKYVYSFSWLGRPIIQLPEDLLRIQEVIFAIEPDVIVETGIAHGGSLVFYASLCKAMGKGRIVGIDIEIRPHNRKAIEEHFLAPWITIIEGSSTSSKVINQVESLIEPNEKVLVILDSCHTKQHVLAELKAYSPMVSVGSYIVATDGIMEDLVGAPRSQDDWSWNNPKQAAIDFIKQNNQFTLSEPGFHFNEGEINERVTSWPSAFLLRNS